MVAIPYVSLTHRLARRLRLSSTLMINEDPEDFFYQGDFRLYPKHLQGMELDNSVLECIPDSSKLDNVIGNDSLLLSAKKMMLENSLLRQQECGIALLPVILGLGQMMILPNMGVWQKMMMSPKINVLCSYNRMMKLLKKILKM
jgi:hypothetical protein